MDESEDSANHSLTRRNSIMVEHSVLIPQPIVQVFVPIPHDEQMAATMSHRVKDSVRKKCVPSWQCARSYKSTLLPFLTWLKVYEIAWLPSDIICGSTVAIMQIPQGMAYALLANLPAVIGLYISFFPPLVYAFFGTSRHLSIGAIAVVSLMTGHVVDRMSVQSTTNTFTSNATLQTASIGAIDPSSAITVATTLAFTVGVIQLILSIFRLGFVTVFLSDAFISGYTTGTAVLVFTSQISDIFGLKLKRYVGPLNIVYTYIEIFKHLNETNLVTLLISISSIVAIVSVKECIEPFYKRRIKRLKMFQSTQIPIPIELIVIIVGTVVSHLFKLNSRYQVRIVKTIGSGFLAPHGASLKLIPDLIKDSIVIAIVSFAICSSLAKTFAKKDNYTIDSNQELTAYGLCNIISSFFSCYPSAASLSRSSVYVNTGGRTQLASLVSCIWLFVIILKIGPLFEPVPKACLAAIIIVALKGLFMQTKDFFTIGRVAKLEAIVWLLTFLSTIILDVDYGLIIGICCSILVVLFRQFRPRTTMLGQIDFSEMRRNEKRYSKVQEFPHIKIFRFESPILFFNADYFRECLFKSAGINIKNSHENGNHCSDQAMDGVDSLTHIIIDCSSMSQIDYSGGKMLIQTIKELTDRDYNVYLCNLRYYGYELLEKLNMDALCSVTLMSSVKDAVQKIQEERQDSKDQPLAPPAYSFEQTGGEKQKN